MADSVHLKFPRTPHLFSYGSATRDDLVFTDQEARHFLQQPGTFVVEEKIDGANIGISVGPNFELLFQNRSHFVNSSSQTQFRNLESWAKGKPGIWDLFQDRDVILFGEWMYAKHSIHYTNLSDLFIAFDIYDKTNARFLKVDERNELLRASDIAVVPELLRTDRLTKDQIDELVASKRSHFNPDSPIEGCYVRLENDHGLVTRCKAVRADFIQPSARHWSKETLTKNVVDFSSSF